MKKVFISSVMNGFDKERATAKSAIESLSLSPVMAEDFGAKPYSPQVVCLEGVKKSDIYLGILGPSYGSVAKSGLSVSEEEFNIARERSIPILLFVMNCTREPRQEEFYKRISSYEEGYFISFFNSCTDFATEITKALYAYVSQGQADVLSSSDAEKHISEHIAGFKHDRQSDTLIVAIVFPVNKDTYISLEDLGNTETKEYFLQPALFGDSAIFSRELGTKEVIVREHISFVQYEQNDNLVNSLDCYPDGTLVWRSALISEVEHGFFTIYSYIIDQDQVRRKLFTFISYANIFYSKLLKKPYISNFFLTSVMCYLQDKKLGRATSKLQNGISLGFKSMPDPLVIPQKPMKIALSKLKNPANLTDNLMELIVRAFKCEGLYHV
jgi:hypothetical protein